MMATSLAECEYFLGRANMDKSPSTQPKPGRAGSGDKRRKRNYRTPSRSSKSRQQKTPNSSNTLTPVDSKENISPTNEAVTPVVSTKIIPRPKSTPSRNLRAIPSPIVRSGSCIPNSDAVSLMKNAAKASTPAPKVVSPEKLQTPQNEAKIVIQKDPAFIKVDDNDTISPFHLHDKVSKLKPVRAKVAAELRTLLTQGKSPRKSPKKASPLKKMVSPLKKRVSPQKRVKPSPAKNTSQPALMTPEKALRRTQVAQEVLSSETTYVNSIQAVINVYAEPLQRAAAREDTSIISNSQIDKIFNNIQVLCTFNSYFLQNLKDRMTSFDPATTIIGDLFLQFAPFFRMYSQYVANFEEVPHILRDLKDGKEKNSKFGRFCAEAQAQPMCSVGLLSLLVMPIQRIPRYRMLLETLVKHTPEMHPDFSTLQESLVLVSKVAESINQDIRLQQNRNRIRTLEEEFVGGVTFSGPSRLYVRQGKLSKKSTNGDREYEFFLFDDLLGYASYVRENGNLHKKYKLVQTIDIRDLTSVQAVTKDDALMSTPVKKNPSKEEEFSFVLIGSRESFVVGCDSSEEGKLWIRDINYYINRASKISSIHKQRRMRESNSSRQVIWRADNSASHCPYCDAAFTLFVRRHHCRQCGNLTCAACSTTKMTVFGSVKPQRVCDACSPWGRQMGEAKEKEIEERQARLGCSSTDWNKMAPISENALEAFQGVGAEARDLHNSALGYKWYGQLLHFHENANWKIVPSEESEKPMEWKLEYPSGVTRQAFKAVALVKAEPEAVCAFLYNTHFESSTQKIIRTFKRSMLVHATVTSRYLWSSTKRDFAIVKDWRKLDNGTYCVLSKSVNSKAVPPVAGMTRGVVFHNGWIIKPFMSEHFCWSEVTYIADLDPRGWVPSWMKTKIKTDQLTALRSLQFQGKFISEAFCEGRFPLDGIHNQVARKSNKEDKMNKSSEELHMTFLKDCGLDPSQVLSDEAASDAKNPAKHEAKTVASPKSTLEDMPEETKRKKEETEPQMQLAMENTSPKKVPETFLPAAQVTSSAVQLNSVQPAEANDDVLTLQARIKELEHENERLQEHVLQVKDYLSGQNHLGTLQIRMEEQLSKSNLELCEVKAENETLLFKLEKMQDKIVALRKQKKCPKCAGSLGVGGVRGARGRMRRPAAARVTKASQQATATANAIDKVLSHSEK